MFKLKNKEDFCGYVANEVGDIKQKFHKIEKKAQGLRDDDRGIAQDIAGHFKELSKDLDSKMESLGSYCPKLSGKKTVEYHAAAGR